MRARLFIMCAAMVFVVACQQGASTPQPVVANHEIAPDDRAAIEDQPPEDGCRRDIPDCSAACALRATHHLEFIDWYDRRCAAVILGKNPDKIAGATPPTVEDAGRSHDDVSNNPYR